MADYYLTVNGEYFDEAGDFNDGIDYVFECRNEGVDAVLCVTGGNATPLTGTEFYLKGASTTITGGVITGWVYCGFNSVSSEEVIKSQEIILDGGTISGNLSLGSHSGDSYVENVTLTVKSGIITGQILTGNKGHVGDVSTVIRVAMTGRRNTPDLCAIMQQLGAQTVTARLTAAVAEFEKRV